MRVVKEIQLSFSIAHTSQVAKFATWLDDKREDKELIATVSWPEQIEDALLQTIRRLVCDEFQLECPGQHQHWAGEFVVIHCI